MASFVHMYTLISVILLTSSTIRGYDWKVPNCKDETFCTERPEDYDLIQAELDEKVSEINGALNLNDFDDSDYYEYDDYYNGTNCAFKTKILKPYTMRTHSTTKVIVQTEFFEQKFRQTTCDYERMDQSSYNPKCYNGISESFTPNCKQKNTLITLYLYDTNSKNIQRQSVEVPVCCYCDITG